MQNKTSFHGIIDWKKADLDSPWLHEALLYMPLAFIQCGPPASSLRWTSSGESSSIPVFSVPWQLTGSSLFFLFLFFFFFFFNFIHLFTFLAALGLRCCKRTLSSCSQQGSFPAAVHVLLLLQSTDSSDARASVTLRHVESSRTRDGTCVPCIDWQADS